MLETLAIDAGELLSKFGPLPQIIASTFGPGMARAIGAGLGGLAGAIGPRLIAALARVLPFAVTAGTTQGVAMGGAAAASATATEAAGVTAGQAVVATTATPAATAAGTVLGRALGLAAAAAIPTLIIGAVVALGPEVSQKVREWFGGPKAHAFDDIEFNTEPGFGTPIWESVNDALDGVPAVIEGAGDTWEREASAATAKIGDGIRGQSDALRGEMQSVEREIHLGLALLAPELRQDAIDAMSAFAGGLLEKRSAVDKAMDALATATENTMSRVAEVAKITGLLTGQELADGIAANDPVVRAQAEATRAIIENRLQQLGVEAKSWGEDAQDALTAGLSSKDPAVRAQAERTNDLIEQELSNHAQHRTVGGAIVDDVDAGMRDPAKAGKLGATAGWLARGIIKGLLGGLLTGATPKVSTALSNAIGFQAFEAGTPFVERDQLAFVHRGEAIIPANKNGLAGMNVTIERIDASGHANPAEVGRSVRQGVADAMADILREQSQSFVAGRA
jgi:hypothetical protein